MRGPSEDSGYEELRPRLNVLLLVKITKVDQNLLRMKHGVVIAKESAHQIVFRSLYFESYYFINLWLPITTFLNCKIPNRAVSHHE